MPRGSAQTYWAYEDDVNAAEDSDPKAQKTVRFELDDEADEGEELAYQAVASERRFTGVRPPASSKPNGQRPSSEQRPRRDASPRRDSNCFGCGGAGHWFAECPSRVTCTLCKTPGHTADACRKKCPACGAAHGTDTECEVAKALEDLKAWYKAEGHAGNGALPASVLQFLN
ncbi:hypothetical protein P43SY_010689 [Pythium insidiosum]|uniref:CCHC-type domain-containing protein n=1 Tax=Pythium insidiosum TaxID=114742 RepID=A0AAD5L5B0_PYTIN|nr:hypothetical protein P43SY_010689 [Pythium insidiosum]